MDRDPHERLDRVLGDTTAAVLRELPILGYLQTFLPRHLKPSPRKLQGSLPAVPHPGSRTLNSTTLMNLMEVRSLRMLISLELEVAAEKKSRRDLAQARVSFRKSHIKPVFLGGLLIIRNSSNWRQKTFPEFSTKVR